MMPTKRILLAVDRSSRAEAVAAIVADTARGAHATVRLLHVAPEASAVQTESLTGAGLDYLGSLEVHFGDVPVESVVRFGDPVTEILAEAESFGADLIVVGTAGRSGIGRVLLGSVAERVFGKATVPVMLLRPTAVTAA